ncbi:MAG: hypothetical protein PVJ76_17845 [Gemmatimonadota bacterium]
MLAEFPIALQGIGEVLQLKGQRFLNGQNVRGLPANGLRHQGTALGPGILAVVRRSVPNVEGHESEVVLLESVQGREAQCRQGQK